MESKLEGTSVRCVGVRSFGRGILWSGVQLVLALVWAERAGAEVRLPNLFSENMVLQQGKQVAVWGWGEEGEKVVVEFRDQAVETTVKEGRWKVHLAPLRAGGPDDLTVRGNNTVQVGNVLVGEVWVASGQSNMQWPLQATYKPEQAIAGSNLPQLRLFSVPRRKSERMEEDVEAAWVMSTPETTPGFSAVAFYFGRALQEALQVPVGIIHTSWGGSPVEVWIREEVLASNPEYREAVMGRYEREAERYQEALVKYEEQKEEGRADRGRLRQPRQPWRPSELYNGMIAPLIPYAMAGAIWYQGESNASQADLYRRLFPDMIGNWRLDWRQGDFPFLAVQLAPWDRNKGRPVEEIAAALEESDWAELREAQLHASKVLPKVGLAVITDVGDKDDIHPTQKRPVGERLALLARHHAYGEELVFSGPIYKACEIDGNRAIITFEHVGSGLVARGGNLRGFSMAEADGEFRWANAVIEGGKVVVTHPAMSEPVAVRYGWADFPVLNLWNEEGLPASPFRTDEYPGLPLKAGE